MYKPLTLYSLPSPLLIYLLPIYVQTSPTLQSTLALINLPAPFFHSNLPPSFLRIPSNSSFRPDEFRLLMASTVTPHSEAFATSSTSSSLHHSLSPPLLEARWSNTILRRELLTSVRSKNFLYSRRYWSKGGFFFFFPFLYNGFVSYFFSQLGPSNGTAQTTHR